MHDRYTNGDAELRGAQETITADTPMTMQHCAVHDKQLLQTHQHCTMHDRQLLQTHQ